MRTKSKKDISVIIKPKQLEFKILCNISPAEIKERREEIKKILDSWQFDCEVQDNFEFGKNPEYFKKLDGFWEYSVKMR